MKEIDQELKEWSTAADRMGEWLVVGSIASVGLDAAPGVVSLLCLMVFFFIRRQNQRPARLERYIKLKESKQRSIEEEIELLRLGQLIELARPGRGITAFTFGYVFWAGSLVYELLVKGILHHHWW
jgi:hypothetical protein